MNMHVVLPLSSEVAYDQEARCWQSYCPELEVYSAGNSQQEAHEALESAIHMTLASYYRHGRLNEFLKERQFEPLPMNPKGTVVAGEVRSPFVLCAGKDDAVCNVTAAV